MFCHIFKWVPKENKIPKKYRWVYLEVGGVATAVVLFDAFVAAGAAHSWMKFFLNLNN